jgi:hypothetical protein
MVMSMAGLAVMVMTSMVSPVCFRGWNFWRDLVKICVHYTV